MSGGAGGRLATRAARPASTPLRGGDRAGASLAGGAAIELVRLEPGVEDEAWEILERHGDKRWSYVDATSFALIERDGGAEAFAFDSHFAQRGLRVLPPP
jgi:uncharacterized protein